MYTCNKKIFDLSAVNFTKIIFDEHNKTFDKICLNCWYSAIFVLLGTCTEYLNEIFCSFVNTNIRTFCFVFH